jgi:hypothetical protein
MELTISYFNPLSYGNGSEIKANTWTTLIFHRQVEIFHNHLHILSISLNWFNKLVLVERMISFETGNWQTSWLYIYFNILSHIQHILNSMIASIVKCCLMCFIPIVRLICCLVYFIPNITLGFFFLFVCL